MEIWIFEKIRIIKLRGYNIICYSNELIYGHVLSNVPYVISYKINNYFYLKISLK